MTNRKERTPSKPPPERAEMRWLVAAIAVFLSPLVYGDAVYQCNVNGRTVFQGEPCPEGSTVRSMHEESSPSARTQAPPEPHPDSKWQVGVGTSPMDDSRNVVLSVEANQAVHDKFDREYLPTLFLRCAEGTTAMFINFDGLFMADTSMYGNVRLRVDDQQAFTVNMSESTNNQSLGLWRGAGPVRMIGRLIGGETLTVRATPYSESPITTTFPIAGLGYAITPLRQACQR